MKRASVLTAIFFTFSLAINAQQPTKEELIAKFTSAEWKDVKAAKEALENLEKDIIPDIITLLKDKRVMKLQNTGSLIYPGAEKQFGYGQIIDYDIDRISVRAGWLLEDLTFNNFGFGGVHLRNDQLESFIKITFPEYYNNSTNRKKIQQSAPEQLQQIIIDQSIVAVEKWWATVESSWSRLEALYNALVSYDEKRQVKALFYLRNGKTKCSGLSKDYYIDKLYREIVRLSSSEVGRVSEHASFIMLDIKFDWLSIKPM